MDTSSQRPRSHLFTVRVWEEETGTYHLYCTIHPGMNLMVIVQ